MADSVAPTRGEGVDSLGEMTLTDLSTSFFSEKRQAQQGYHKVPVTPSLLSIDNYLRGHRHRDWHRLEFEDEIRRQKHRPTGNGNDLLMKIEMWVVGAYQQSKIPCCRRLRANEMNAQAHRAVAQAPGVFVR
jgi:hypothetical protein